MSSRSKKVLIRCDGGSEIGFGHVVRCMALADELRGCHGCQVDFAMLRGVEGIAQVQAQGYEVHQKADGVDILDEGNWVQDLVIDFEYKVLILDVRSEIATKAIQSIRESRVLIVTIDDPSDCRLYADLVFYPPVPQVERFDWTGFTGQRYVGWDWVLLRSQFAEPSWRACARVAKSLTESPRADLRLVLLITMGGSDPAGLTLLALEAIEKMDGDFRVLVVIGCGFMHDSSLDEFLTSAKRNYEVVRDVSEMAPLMAEADLAVVAFGVTAYELAALGVKAIYICLTSDHAEAAEALVAEGAGISMGDYKKITPVDLAQVLTKACVDDYSFRMGGQFAQCIDGLAAKRIASIIASKKSDDTPNFEFDRDKR